MSENISIEHELAPLCAGNAHPEYPLLRIGYAPVSRYPAADFTPWIAQQLQVGRLESIASLMVALTEPNLLGPSPESRHQWALRLAKLDLHKSLTFQDERAYCDFHAALFPYALRGATDGYIIADRHVDYLARAVSPFPFKVPDLERRVSAANAFIRKRRIEEKKTECETNTVIRFWADFPLYGCEILAAAFRSEAPAQAVRSRLAEATVGARQVFFGTLLEGAGQGAWNARPYGVNEELTSAELVSLGLGVFLDDPFLVLMTLKKEDLLAALDGFPTKQG